jgi:hypothetical protein
LSRDDHPTPLASPRAAAILMKLPVESARADRPEPEIAGEVRLVRSADSREKARRMIVGVLCGPAQAGQPIRFENLDVDASGDVGVVAILMGAFGMGADEFFRLERHAERLRVTPAYGSLLTRCQDALLERGVLGADEIAELA